MLKKWKRLDLNHADSRVEKQLDEYGCGAACVVMLLADRGIQVDQLEVAAELMLPSTAHALAHQLNVLSAPRFFWIGGVLDVDPPLRRVDIETVGPHLSWAAQLIPAGARDGHWVVVDEMTAAGVKVRDPAGATYRMIEGEFLTLMRHTVMVFERGEQT